MSDKDIANDDVQKILYNGSDEDGGDNDIDDDES